MTQIRSNSVLLFIYLLFIIYGSLFPLSDWRLQQQSLLAVWADVAGMRVSRSDLLVNLLAYIPFGLFVFNALPQRYGKAVRILQTLLLGALLSFCMEYLQLYLPVRTSSPVDLLLNTVSTAFGAVLACSLESSSTIGAIIWRIRSRHFCDGSVADIGIAVIAVWCAAQLAPFAPTLDIGSIKQGLKPLWLTLNDLSRFNDCRLATYTLNIFSLGTVLLLTLRIRQSVFGWMGLVVGGVLLSKIAIVGRQLSLEALLGLFAGMLLTWLVRSFPRRLLLYTGVTAVMVAFVVDELRTDYLQTVAFHDFNWIPFGSQAAENVTGFGSIIEGLWPFVALGFFAVSLSESGINLSRLAATAIIAVMVFSLEYAQTGIVGRYPDITPVILACLGYQLPWFAYRNALAQ
jgi:glycopeptide antibiotics resistance protein